MSGSVTEFIVIAHNPQGSKFQQLIRIKLPSANFTAQVWSPALKAFSDVATDILEQNHWKKTGEEFTDFEMYIEAASLEVEDGLYIIKIKANGTATPLVAKRPKVD